MVGIDEELQGWYGRGRLDSLEGSNPYNNLTLNILAVILWYTVNERHIDLRETASLIRKGFCLVLVWLALRWELEVLA